MTNRNCVPRLLFGALMILFASGAAGSSVTKLNDDVFQPLRASMLARKIVIDRLPVYDDKRSIIELEEFQVWAPEGKIIIHGDYGKVLKTLAPPPMRFFRGLVNGDPESFAYFSMDPSGRNIQGFVVTPEKRFTVASVRRLRAGQRPRHGEDPDAMDTYLQAFDDSDTLNSPPPPWKCEVDGHQTVPSTPAIHATGLNGLPVVANGITGTQSYAITVDIETDNELYVNAGSNSATLTTYITNLSGAVSTIYNRDLKTNVTQRNVNIYTSVSDPWSATTASGGLSELGDHYNGVTLNGFPPAVRTSSGVVFLSGKSINSGIAWEGIICGADGGSLHNYFGPYAWCGSIGVGGLGTVPDPNSTQDGTLDGMPPGFQAYWPLAEYAHEFGHNLAGHHTHCVVITAAETIAAGFTDGSTANFVDHCYGHESDFGGPTDCYGGAATAPNYVPGSQSIYKGTIMSYCHNVFAGTGGVYPQSRFIFGLGTEPSHHELDDYMLNASGPGQMGTGGCATVTCTPGGNSNIVTGTSALTLSSISSSTTVAPNSTGNTATATLSPSASAYAWTITNGTITGGATSSTVTFTAGASGTVTLRVTGYGTNHCGITDTKSITIASALAAPTGVDAHATTNTNINIKWNSVTGATDYQVLESTDGLTFNVFTTTSSLSVNRTVMAGNAYLYRVHARDAGMNPGPDSVSDLAAAVVFTNSLTAGVTVVSALDFTEVRTAVNAVERLAGIMNTAYTDPTLDNTVMVKKVHIDEPLTRLNNARTQLRTNGSTNLANITLSGGTITAGTTAIRASDINDLRGGTY